MTVTLYKYKSWKISNSFNLEMLLKILNAYVEGKSSFSVTAGKEIIYFNDKSFVYGINVLTYIVNDENCIKEFIKDDRQLNQIKEHYLVILEMLTFMSNIKVVSYDEYVDLTTRFEELKRACEYIINLVEECSMSLTSEKRDLLRKLLLQLADKDELVTRNLINILSKKL